MVAGVARTRPWTCTRANSNAAVRNAVDATANTAPTSATETSTPATRGTGERADPLDGRRRTVRRDQLLRRPRQRWQERLQGRPDERRSQPHEAGQGEDNHLALAEKKHARRTPGRR